MDDMLYKMEGIHYAYHTSAGTLTIFEHLDFSLKKGESVALVGPSGCGKSTFLHLAGLLDTAKQGTIHFQDTLVSGLSSQERTKIRLGNMGFIYQHHHLLPEFNALENVMMPMWIAQKFLGFSRKTIRQKAHDILDKIGLADRKHHYPSQLSGGQQQRVAIARALVHTPPLIIADEPTGNLDPEKAGEVLDLLLQNVKQNTSSLLMATHNLSLSEKCDRICTIENGHLVTVSHQPNN